ncbi:MAG: aspartate-semialdehyde dehydrogenase [Erythrobacter sp.]|nr:aspartate-semialdehyde dehydrogenase [Erythrobacter sp.]
MRIALLALTGAIALSACDSGEVPSPAERQQGDTGSTAAIADNHVELRTDGLAAGAEAFFFAAGQAEVEAALAKALGASLRTGSNAECGAGPITFTDFPGGLTAHFQEQRLVGWNWHLAQDGDLPGNGTVKLAGDLQLGSPRSAAQAAPGFAPVEGSTLGEEFALGDNIGGFIEAEKVAMLYAGTQCFFR